MKWEEEEIQRDINWTNTRRNLRREVERRKATKKEVKGKQ